MHSSSAIKVMNRNRLLCVCTLFALCVLAGCSSGPNKRNLYTLHEPEITTQGTAFNFVSGLGIGPIVLPESLSHPEVVVYSKNNHVSVNPTYLWAGDLKRAISRVMAATIGSSTTSANVWAYPWDARTRPERQVSLVIERLGGSLGGIVELRAQWRLLSGEGRVVESIGHCRFSRQTPDASYDTYVAAINEVVNECATLLVKEVVSL